MGLFDRKRKVALKDFCQSYYEAHIFSNDPSVDFGEVYAKTVKRLVEEVEPKFSSVDLDALYYEMRLVRLELFALAWIHQLGEEHAAAQSDFSKAYLGRLSIVSYWSDLKLYNDAIAQSSEHGRDQSTDKTYLASLNLTRLRLLEEWTKKGFDPEAVARAVNRAFARKAWGEKITQNYMAAALCERLGCGLLNDEGRFRISAVINGFYDGIHQNLKSIKVAN